MSIGLPEAHESQRPPRRPHRTIVEIVETLVLTLVIYLALHTFVAQPFEVQQTSMSPTILSDEYILIDKLSTHWQPYRRGDVAVFEAPPGFDTAGVPFIKRIIGLPGDTVRIENGRVFLTPPGGATVELTEPYVDRATSGEAEATLPKDAHGRFEWTVPEGHYFVLGDNRSHSQDSRAFGPIAADSLVGRAWLRYFPLDRITVMSPSGTVRALTSE